jgi:hypothetical protein
MPVLVKQSVLDRMVAAVEKVKERLLRDLLGVGLLDATWPARFPSELAERLQLLIDTPDG